MNLESLPKYPITVPYQGGKTIKKLLSLGRYDWFNPQITDEHFPHDRKSTDNLIVELVHFDREIATEEVLRELSERTLRPANVAELLAVGASYRNLQRQFPIGALGQVWSDGFGNRFAVWLDDPRRKKERAADIGLIECTWCGICRFAAVPK